MKIVLFFSLVLFSTQSLAWVHPQIFYQPGEGEQAVSPALSFATVKVEVPGSETTSKVTNLNAQYQYGLSGRLALNVELGYASTSRKTGASSADSSGLEDILIGIHSYRGNAMAQIRYGVNLSLSSDAEFDANFDQTNEFTGGQSINPYIGLSHRVGSAFVGAIISTEILLGNRDLKFPNGSVDSSGGNSTNLSLYYEHQMEESQIGLRLDYIITSDTDFNGLGTQENATVLGAEAYGAFEIDESIILLPVLAYGFITDSSLNGVNIDSSSVFGAELGARFEF